jgi:hypothetical protein
MDASITSGGAMLPGAGDRLLGQVVEALASRDILANMLGEDGVDERLVADATPPSLLAKTLEDRRIEADRNELARFLPERWAADAPHRPELFG